MSYSNLKKIGVWASEIPLSIFSRTNTDLCFSFILILSGAKVHKLKVCNLQSNKTIKEGIFILFRRSYLASINAKSYRVSTNGKRRHQCDWIKKLEMVKIKHLEKNIQGPELLKN